jgi:hypothetical protein
MNYQISSEYSFFRDVNSAQADKAEQGEHDDNRTDDVDDLVHGSVLPAVWLRSPCRPRVMTPN